MNIVIIEDEKASYNRLSSQIKELNPEYEVIACIDTVESAIKWFTENPLPELIFLDVQLSDGVCFEIYEKINIEAPVIFTTAYDNYTMKAFELNSIDYLLKPVNIDKLSHSLDKFKTMKNLFKAGSFENQIQYFLNNQKWGQKPYRLRFLIPQYDGYIPILVEDVSYFYAEDNYIIITTKKGGKHSFHYSLDKLEQELDPDFFWRANRSFIISANSIKKAHNYFNYKIKLELVPETSKEVIISRKKVHDFKLWFDA